MLELIFYLSVIGYCLYSIVIFTLLFINDIFKKKGRKKRYIRRNNLRDQYFGDEFNEWKTYKENSEHAKSRGDTKFFSDLIIKYCSELRTIIPFETNKKILIRANEDFFILISHKIPESLNQNDNTTFNISD